MLIRAVRAGLAATEQRLASLTATISREVPDYSDTGEPCARVDQCFTAEVLRPDEVLVQFHFGSYGSYAWLVSREAARWTRLALGRGAIASKVAALRCGLDSAAWYGSGEYTCQQLLKTDYGADDLRKGKPLPFDLAVAYDSRVDETAAPGARHREANRGNPSKPGRLRQRRMAREAPCRHRGAICRGSKALRQHNRVSQAERGYVAFANPLLWADHRQTTTTPVAPGKLRKSSPVPGTSQRPLSRPFPSPARCPKRVPACSVVGSATWRRCAPSCPYPRRRTRSVRSESARRISSDVLLGARATEAAIKKLSAKGALATYKVLHCATHGLVAGETDMRRPLPRRAGAAAHTS